MEFSRQEYWSSLPFPSPWDLPDPGMETVPPVSPALAGRFFKAELPLILPKKQVPIMLSFLPPRHCQIVLPDPSVLGRAHETTPSQRVHRWVTAFNCQCKDSPSRALPLFPVQGPLAGYPGPSESRAHLPNGMEYSLREKKSLSHWDGGEFCYHDITSCL